VSIRSAMVACLFLAQLAPGAAFAQAEMELPGSEDREVWLEAWRAVADEEGGDAAIPAITVASTAEGWSLSVRGSDGTLRTVPIQPPQGHSDRVDVLYLAISLAQRRDEWGWSAIEEAEPVPDEPEAPVEATPDPAPSTPAKPVRRFVSANAGPSTVSAPLPTEPEPTTPPIAVAGGEPLAPTPSISAPSADEPEPPPLDPIFPEPRDPIPILDDPNPGPWPSWMWLQLGGGPSWRPETSLAWEGALRGGWTSDRLRLAMAMRATSPTRLTAFHDQSERSAWDLDLLAGPWVPISERLDAGLEGGVVFRRFRQQGQGVATDTLPTAALELAMRLPLGPFTAGPYLRGTVDLATTRLDNGPDDPDPVDLQLWCLTLGVQVAEVPGVSSRRRTR